MVREGLLEEVTVAKAYLGCSGSTEEACDSSGRSQGSVTDGSRDPVRRQMAPGGPLKTFGSYSETGNHQGFWAEERHRRACLHRITLMAVLRIEGGQ